MKALHSISVLVRGAAVALAAISIAGPAFAHHPLGGALPSTFWQGMLSGLAHPIIELEHFLFLLCAGSAIALARVMPGQALILLFFYAVAGATGTLWHVPGGHVPAAELAIAVSLGVIAVVLWNRRVPGQRALAGLAAGGGFFHGYAYGEAVIGAETAPVLSYLLGLALIQTLLMTGTFYITRRIAGAAPDALKVATRMLGILAVVMALWLVWSQRLLA